MITIKNLHLQQRMQVWTPRYNDKYGDYGEPVALLHKGKVYHGSSQYIIVEFTKSPSLKDLRFCISRENAKKHETGTNGSAAMLIVPMSHLQPYVTFEEDKARIKENLLSWGWWKERV